MLDANSGFLLCSNASPICPDSLCNESGFFKVGSEKSAGTPLSRYKKDKLKDQLDKAERSSEMIQKAVGALTEFIEHKREAANKQTPKKNQEQLSGFLFIIKIATLHSLRNINP